MVGLLRLPALASPLPQLPLGTPTVALLLLLLSLPAAGAVRPAWSWETLQPFLHTSDLDGLMDAQTTQQIADHFPMVRRRRGRVHGGREAAPPTPSDPGRARR